MANQVMLTRSVLESCVRSYKYDKASHFVTRDQLKPKQITNALARFAPGVRERDLVALMDTTLFESGKDGYLLTETHMYGKSLEGKTIDLNRMCKLNRKDSYLTVTYPDGKADTLFVSIFHQDLFNLLKMIMEESQRLNEQAESEPLAELGKELERLLDPGASEGLREELISSTPEPISPEPEPEEKEPAIIPTPVFDPIEEPDEDPKPSGEGGEDGEACFAQGKKLFLAKDYSGAIAAFQRAADLGHQKAAQFLVQLKAIVGSDT